MNKNQQHFTVDLAPLAAKRSSGRYYPEDKHPFRLVIMLRIPMMVLKQAC